MSRGLGGLAEVSMQNQMEKDMEVHGGIEDLDFCSM